MKLEGFIKNGTHINDRDLNDFFFGLMMTMYPRNVTVKRVQNIKLMKFYPLKKKIVFFYIYMYRNRNTIFLLNGNRISRKISNLNRKLYLFEIILNILLKTRSKICPWNWFKSHHFPNLKIRSIELLDYIQDN